MPSICFCHRNSAVTVCRTVNSQATTAELDDIAWQCAAFPHASSDIVSDSKVIDWQERMIL